MTAKEAIQKVLDTFSRRYGSERAKWLVDGKHGMSVDEICRFSQLDHAVVQATVALLVKTGELRIRAYLPK